MIRTLPGFEAADIQRYAYAVEYDALDPTQLDVTLMSKQLPGLFSAGQINGTSGYEEAAVQGFVAGVNAARFAAGMERVTVRRDQGYVGVLLDDLVRWGIDEPYRMLTSRNEYRLLHRQDNADERMSAIGHAWGTIDDVRLEANRRRWERIHAEVERLRRVRVGNDDGTKLLRRGDMSYVQVIDRVGRPVSPLDHEEARRVETLVRYEAYIERSRNELEARTRYEQMSLASLSFDRVPSLSNEGRDMLTKARPATLGAAQRLRGVRDSDVTALLVHLRRNGPVSRETSIVR
jgi:tRNA uridine 5-carboxymethylaminomethyl modification enzyme